LTYRQSWLKLYRKEDKILREAVKSSLIILFISVSSISAQWLETTIILPDTLSGVRSSCLAYDSTRNIIFVGGRSHYGGAILVVDGYDYQNLTRILVDTFPDDLVWNPFEDKLYSVNTLSNTISVIDGTNYQLLGTICCGLGPDTPVLHSVLNKLYITNSNSSDISVIDCGSDSIVTTITL
jgi:YVTN family beta-propeller protein